MSTFQESLDQSFVIKRLGLINAFLQKKTIVIRTFYATVTVT